MFQLPVVGRGLGHYVKTSTILLIRIFVLISSSKMDVLTPKEISKILTISSWISLQVSLNLVNNTEFSLRQDRLRNCWLGLQCILKWLCSGRDSQAQLQRHPTNISRVQTSTGLHRYQPDCNFSAFWISLLSNCPGILTSSSRLLATLCIFRISRKLTSPGN